MQFKIILVSNVVELGNIEVIYRSLSPASKLSCSRGSNAKSAKVDFNIIPDSKVLYSGYFIKLFKWVTLSQGLHGMEGQILELLRCILILNTEVNIST